MFTLPDPPERPRGRYAPTPSGFLHVGCARTALVAWLSIRSRGGDFLWRVENLDPPREVEGAADAAMEDLQWLGLDWDEGPDVGGAYGPYCQSDRGPIYEEALEHLLERERLFPCSYSRKDLREISSAPHGHSGRPPYPASLRPERLNPDWFTAFREADPKNPDAAVRFKVADGEVAFEDLLQGSCREVVADRVGDFVLKRRDGLYAYQLAVVVDDLLMNVTEVVRGTDLLASTARQIQLIEALGGELPTYAHVPLVVRHDGEKLSKRNDDIKLRTLRERGADPMALCGLLGHSLGLLPEPRRCTPHELVDRFDWDAIPREPWRLPADVLEMIR